MKNVRFKDLADNSELDYLSNNKEMLKADEMASILGGAGCESRICENNRDYGVDKYCQGANAACVSGIGVCLDKTGMVAVDPPIPNDGREIVVPDSLVGGIVIGTL